MKKNWIIYLAAFIVSMFLWPQAIFGLIFIFAVIIVVAELINKEKK